MMPRREFIAAAAGSMFAVAGCAQEDGPASPTPSAPPSSFVRDPPRHTFSSLIADRPFYIAHRGGGRNWPEMTAYAYENAISLPHVRAVEISVVKTSDDVLVCHHDLSTTRVTGVAHVIGETEWATLKPLLVTAAYTDDPTQPYRPITRLDEILPRMIQTHVVFIEPKAPEAVTPLQDYLSALNQPTRTVWKQPINQRNFAWAKESGFATWGYALDEPSHLGERLEKFIRDPDMDMVGIEYKRRDEDVRTMVEIAGDVGKAVVMTNVETAQQRRRALDLGCRGLMTPNIAKLPLIPV